MSESLFCYGTLVFPEILEIVTGRQFDHVDCRLENYQSFIVSGESFPGLIFKSGSITGGSLLKNIRVSEMRTLDEYEGGLYRRKKVNVIDRDNAVHVAWVYEIRNSRKKMLSKTLWDKAEFQRLHLQDFISLLRT